MNAAIRRQIRRTNRRLAIMVVDIIYPVSCMIDITIWVLEFCGMQPPMSVVVATGGIVLILLAIFLSILKGGLMMMIIPSHDGSLASIPEFNIDINVQYNVFSLLLSLLKLLLYQIIVLTMLLHFLCHMILANPMTVCALIIVSWLIQGWLR